MRAAWLLVPGLVCVGCGGSTTAPQHAAEVEPASPGAPRQPARVEIQQLAAAVERVPGAVPAPNHAAVAAALSRLADVVRIEDADAAREIDRLGGDLMRSAPGASTHADLTQRALARALEALAARLPREPSASLQRAYVIAQRASDGVDPDAPLSRQIAGVTAALRSLTNLAAALDDAPLPFAEAPALAELRYDPAQLRDRANLASAAVAELARERDWKRAGARASHALDTLANVIEVAPLTVTPTEWRSLVLAVRFEAIEARRGGAITLERADRIKAGLASCVEALAHIVDDRREPPLTALVANARSAVDAIEGSRSWVFQRGILQEAFRTTADAFLVVASPPERTRPMSARR